MSLKCLLELILKQTELHVAANIYPNSSTSGYLTLLKSDRFNHGQWD